MVSNKPPPHQTQEGQFHTRRTVPGGLLQRTLSCTGPKKCIFHQHKTRPASYGGRVRVPTTTLQTSPGPTGSCLWTRETGCWSASKWREGFTQTSVCHLGYDGRPHTTNMSQAWGPELGRHGLSLLNYIDNFGGVAGTEEEAIRHFSLLQALLERAWGWRKPSTKHAHPIK